MWPKDWSFSFIISPSNKYSELISFRLDWLDLLAVQGTLKSLLQHHSSKASILQRSAFFIIQLSHPYMTTGKTIALTRRTFVDKVMSLLFNMLSRLIITFLPKSKRLLIFSSQPLAIIILLYISMDLPVLNISYRILYYEVIAVFFVFFPPSSYWYKLGLFLVWGYFDYIFFEYSCKRYVLGIWFYFLRPIAYN